MEVVQGSIGKGHDHEKEQRGSGPEPRHVVFFSIPDFLQQGPRGSPVRGRYTGKAPPIFTGTYQGERQFKDQEPEGNIEAKAESSGFYSPFQVGAVQRPGAAGEYPVDFITLSQGEIAGLIFSQDRKNIPVSDTGQEVFREDVSPDLVKGEPAPDRKRPEGVNQVDARSEEREGCRRNSGFKNLT